MSPENFASPVLRGSSSGCLCPCNIATFVFLRPGNIAASETVYWAWKVDDKVTRFGAEMNALEMGHGDAGV